MLRVLWKSGIFSSTESGDEEWFVVSDSLRQITFHAARFTRRHGEELSFSIFAKKKPFPEIIHQCGIRNRADV